MGSTKNLLAQSIEDVESVGGMCDAMRIPGAANNLFDTSRKLRQVQKRISAAIELLDSDTIDWATVNAARAILKGNIEAA